MVTEKGVPLFAMSDIVESDSCVNAYFLFLGEASEFDELIAAITPANVEKQLKTIQGIQELF